jgi:hypothetical protein
MKRQYDRIFFISLFLLAVNSTCLQDICAENNGDCLSDQCICRPRARFQDNCTVDWEVRYPGLNVSYIFYLYVQIYCIIF